MKFASLEANLGRGRVLIVYPILILFAGGQIMAQYYMLMFKDKDKEALFNVAYNVTDNISSWAILRHNNYIFNRYLPVFISLAQPLLCERQQGSC